MAAKDSGDSEMNQIAIPSEILDNVQTCTDDQWRHFRSTHRNRDGHIHNNFYRVEGNRQVQIGNYNTMNDYDSSSEEEEEEEDEMTKGLSVIEIEELQEIRSCQLEVSTKQLQDLARNLGAPWRLIMRGLGIPMFKVDQMYEECSSAGMDEVLFQLLRGWREQAFEPTVSKMLGVVERAGQRHLWKYLRPERD